jgi:hypothetical protein
MKTITYKAQEQPFLENTRIGPPPGFQERPPQIAFKPKHQNKMEHKLSSVASYSELKSLPYSQQMRFSSAVIPTSGSNTQFPPSTKSNIQPFISSSSFSSVPPLQQSSQSSQSSTLIPSQTQQPQLHSQSSINSDYPVSLTNGLLF